MSEKPEALRLADECDWSAKFKAAKELRRLHAENERLRELLTEAKAEIHASKNYELLGKINAVLPEDKT